jgi:hypothetical protein
MDALDVKGKIEALGGKIKGDEALLAKFKSDPGKAVEGLLGAELPDDVLRKLVSGVKAKLDLDQIGGALGSLGGLLGKK